MSRRFFFGLIGGAAAAIAAPRPLYALGSRITIEIADTSAKIAVYPWGLDIFSPECIDKILKTQIAMMKAPLRDFEPGPWHVPHSVVR